MQDAVNTSYSPVHEKNLVRLNMKLFNTLMNVYIGSDTYLKTDRKLVKG